LDAGAIVWGCVNGLGEFCTEGEAFCGCGEGIEDYCCGDEGVDVCVMEACGRLVVLLVVWGVACLVLVEAVIALGREFAVGGFFGEVGVSWVLGEESFGFGAFLLVAELFDFLLVLADLALVVVFLHGCTSS